MNTETNYRDILKNKLEERCLINPSYSLRAFARDLTISPDMLSRIINGKKGISEETAKKICTRLGFSEDEKDFFINLVLESDSRSKEKRRIAATKLSKYRITRDEKHQLQLEAFKVISDWQHFAILELMLLDNFKNSTAWISRKLGLNIKQIELAIDRMKKLGIIIKDKNGKLKAENTFIDVLSGPPSEAVKKFHKQVIEKNLLALYTQSIEERDFSTTILAFDSAQIKEAKKIIQEFGTNFHKRLPASNKKDSVYSLSMQFCRIDKKLNEKGVIK